MSRTVRSLLPAAEVALVALSLAVVVGFARLFNNGSFFPRLAAFAIVAHLAAIFTRRAGWSVAASGAASLLALGVTVGLALYPDTTFFGLPTASTLSSARADLGDVWNQFQSVQAPTPVTTPFLLAAGLSLWWSAFVADWAAFRVWVPFESVVPAGTVFVFSSLFAAQRLQVPLAGLFLSAAMAFLLIHRVTRQQSNTGWVSADVQRGTNALLRAGAVLAIVAVATAMVVGPNLPQARSAAIIAWRGNGGGGPSARTTVSPLVDIGHRLVDQSNQELFTVRSDQRSYWRLTALDQFDGQIWKSDGSYESAHGGLPRVRGNANTTAQTTSASQQYLIESLDTIWLPAAFEPRAIANASSEVRYEPITSTLIVGTNVANSNRASYTVQSAIPVFDPFNLQQASPQIPSDVATKDLGLPADFSPRVAAEARNAVGGATTEYDKALALQDYFRSNFAYDLTVGPGHGEPAIERFLFDAKAGYCEQFAGTYAAMARSLGIPSRVAVGFTPGDEDPAVPGLYHVRGLHAHAWPEVYINGQGWVLFEPTPGRGAPNAQQYTHVAESQATAGGTATTLVPTTASTAAINPSSAGPATTLPSSDVNTGASGKRAAQPSFWSTNRLGGKALVSVAALLVLALLYVVAVLTFFALYRQRRRRAATAADDRVRLAWQESIEAFGVLGIAPRRAETPAEFGARAGSVTAVDGVGELAGLVVRSNYSIEGATDAEAQRAFALSEQVSSSVKAQSPPSARVLAALDPRPLERRRPISRKGPTSRKRGDAPIIEILRLE
jgi:transglutaminase-like putative cysteine protease/preprotein translocase subunit YajC